MSLPVGIPLTNMSVAAATLLNALSIDVGPFKAKESLSFLHLIIELFYFLFLLYQGANGKSRVSSYSIFDGLRTILWVSRERWNQIIPCLPVRHPPLCLSDPNCKLD